MKVSRLFFLLLLMTLISCKKDRLKGDKEIFVGTWKWAYSDATIGICEGMAYTTEITPLSEGHEYSIVFEKRGKVLFYKDGVEVNNHRVVFLGYGTPNLCGAGYDHFAINLDNDPGTNPEKGIEGCVKIDTMAVHIGFPFYTDGCSLYVNYFVKG